MRRAALIACLAALALPAGAQARGAEAPELELGTSSCVTGVEVAARSATFTASMPAVAGSSVLAMRFDLERRRGTAWKRVPASTFGRWERSAAGAGGFVYAKRVQALPAPATFRATVRFRWHAADGRVLREVRRHTPACRQSERRPDLVPVRITPGAVAADGAATYAVVVRNTGLTDVLRTFSVRLQVADVLLAPRTGVVLAASRASTITFLGPACRPGDALRATVDVTDAVDEADERDNTLLQRCVAAG